MASVREGDNPVIIDRVIVRTLKSTVPAYGRPVFSISVAAEILETHPRTLMLYETKGVVVPARVGSRRRYSQRDLDLVRAYQVLHREHQVTSLAGAKIIVDLLRRIEAGSGVPEELIDVAGLIRGEQD